jgi:hypothetical protein
VKYGFATNGRLYYDPSNIVTDYACKPIKTIQIDKDDPIDTIPIIMVDRGDCTFVTKVRNVQNIGGAVALIVNNKEDEGGIFGLNDDGTGSDIKIPGILITKKDGEILKKFFAENANNSELLSKIILAIDNQLQILMDKVEMKIDFLPNDRKVYQLLNKLSRNSEIMKSPDIKIIPNYITRLGFKYDETKAEVYQNCFCNGRYCPTVGEYFSSSFLNVDSLPILSESIRQKCLYNISTQDYFNYMNNFYKTCISAYPMDFTTTCSEKVLNEINSTTADKVTECFNKSFEFDLTKDTSGSKVVDQKLTCMRNSILEKDATAVEKKVKNALPIIYVNDFAFYGAWTNDNVLEAICSVMKNKPESCFTQLDVFEDNSWTHIKTSHLAIIGIIFILFNLAVFMAFRRCVKNKIDNRMTSDDINDKIGAIVHSYLKMRDQK